MVKKGKVLEDVERPNCAFAFEDDGGMVNVMAADVDDFVVVMDYVLKFKRVQDFLKGVEK